MANDTSESAAPWLAFLVSIVVVVMLCAAVFAYNGGSRAPENTAEPTINTPNLQPPNLNPPELPKLNPPVISPPAAAPTPQNTNP
ncbi:MAG: hypothetical protein ABUS57_02390 [Pseudomonadota bacterium]